MDMASTPHRNKDHASTGKRQDESTTLVSADFSDSNELICAQAAMLDRLIGAEIAKLFRMIQ
jgi:hypothetical protein